MHNLLTPEEVSICGTVMMQSHKETDLRSAVGAQSIITISIAVMTMIIIQLGGAEEERQLKVSKLSLSQVSAVLKTVVCVWWAQGIIGYLEISLLRSSILVNLCFRKHHCMPLLKS